MPQNSSDSKESDRMLTAFETLCKTTQKAFREHRTDEFASGLKRIRRVALLLRSHSRIITVISKQTDQENLIIDLTPIERQEEGTRLVEDVRIFCSWFNRLVEAGRTEDVKVLVPYLKAITALCSSLQLEGFQE